MGDLLNYTALTKTQRADTKYLHTMPGGTLLLAKGCFSNTIRRRHPNQSNGWQPLNEQSE